MDDFPLKCIPSSHPFPIILMLKGREMIEVTIEIQVLDFRFVRTRDNVSRENMLVCILSGRIIIIDCPNANPGV